MTKGQPPAGLCGEGELESFVSFDASFGQGRLVFNETAGVNAFLC
jgi:hypothetical protein